MSGLPRGTRPAAVPTLTPEMLKRARYELRDWLGVGRDALSLLTSDADKIIRRIIQTLAEAEERKP